MRETSALHSPINATVGPDDVVGEYALVLSEGEQHGDDQMAVRFYAKRPPFAPLCQQRW